MPENSKGGPEKGGFESGEIKWFQEGDENHLKKVESWQAGQTLSLEELDAPPDYSELSPKEKFGWASDKLGQVKARLEHFSEALGREDDEKKTAGILEELNKMWEERMLLEQLTSQTRTQAFSSVETGKMAEGVVLNFISEARKKEAKTTGEAAAIKQLEDYLKIRKETVEAWEEMRTGGFDKASGVYEKWQGKKAELAAVFDSFSPALREELMSLENWGRDAGVKEAQRVLDGYKAEILAEEIKKAAA